MKTTFSLLAAASLLACTPVVPAPTCAAPLASCEGACVDPQNDARHCGACGMACGAGQRCAAGVCKTSCAAGSPDVCGTGPAALCTRLSTDPTNCGACGNVCPAGTVCAAGTCAASCGSALSPCGSGAQAICADLSRDANHCGSCDAACPAGQQCVSGACACPAVTPDACGSGGSAFCTSLQTDSGNCGACGVACAAGQQCVAGNCACAAATPDACGAGAAAFCTDLQRDQANCGACGVTCAAGQQCVAGSCACATATPDACGTGTAAFCTQLQTDATNCGGCGVTCAAGQQCVAGSCACAAATPDACGTGAAAFCTNFQTDVTNCGGCGVSCAAGKQCVAGSCACASATPDACGTGTAAFCTDLQTDVTNCGGCGISCAAGKQCVAGSCACSAATPDACGTGATAFCTAFQTDLTNCGGCGVRCGEGEICAGSCVLSCPAGASRCPAGGPGTYCARLTDDPQNCGSCGTVCGGGTVCNAGVCSAPLPAPRQLAPLSTASVTSWRPTLRWQPVSGATGYQVELCATRACTTVTALSATTTSVTPATDLQRGVVYWRVRAANPGALFSPVWEFFVGARSAPISSSWGQYFDVNGDGRPDVGASSAGGRGHLYLGAAGGLPNTPSITFVTNARIVASGGDLNGDGYGDFLIGTPYGGTNSILVYFGAPAGPALTPNHTLLAPSPSGTDWGSAVAGLGDVNGDGYADLAGCFGRSSSIRNCYLYPGGTGALSISGAPMAGSNISGAGDVNGDGYGDAVVTTGTGLAFYLGGTTGLTLAAAYATPAGQFALGEASACAGDVNGDGYADVVAATGGGSAAYVFMGGSGGISTSPVSLPGTSGSGSGINGNIDTAGDVNGDGYSDIVFGKYNGNAVAVFHGAAAGIGTTPATNHPGPSAGGYGAGVLGAGDVNGDGFDDIVMSPTQCSGHNILVLGGSATGVAATLNTWAPPSQCFGYVFSR